MVAYQFYWYDPVKGYELVGVLPERRKNPERITQESIMGWAKKILGDKLSTKDIYIIQVPINEYGEMVFQPAPFKK
jgi:hypothetical protein